MIKDWLFSEGSYICHFRAAGVLIRDSKILLQKHNDEYALPGGHVAFGETSEDALIREIKEEIGADILCDNLLWVEENFWNWGSKKAHNILFYYYVSFINDKNIDDDFIETSKDNKDVLFQWVPIDELKQITVFPPFIKDEIYNISGPVKHFIRSEW